MYIEAKQLKEYVESWSPIAYCID